MKTTLLFRYFNCLFLQSIVVLFFILNLSTIIQAKSITEKSKIISEAISQKYKLILHELTPEIQKHYAIRIYRITGDSSYIPYVLDDLSRTLTTLENDLQNFEDSVYIQQREKELLGKMNLKTRKGHVRQILFKQNIKLLFYLDFLYNTNKLFDYQLHNTTYKTLYINCIKKIQQIDYKSFLTDSLTIRTYAAQAVNYVYYLQQLQIVDFNEEYLKNFQTVFPDSFDKKLTKNEFRDKIYGLTHIIISASRYYQEIIDSSKFDWILKYFDKNINKIINNCTPDIVAEVGLCYQLTGYHNNESLERCIKKVIKSFDKKKNMILSPNGDADVSIGEHRNILAIMLLSWGDTLYEGPPLSLK